MQNFKHLRERVLLRRSLPSPASCRAIREEAGISLRTLARELDVTASTVSRWERGLHAPGRRDKDRQLLERYVEAVAVMRGSR